MSATQLTILRISILNIILVFVIFEFTADIIPQFLVRYLTLIVVLSLATFSNIVAFAGKNEFELHPTDWLYNRFLHRLSRAFSRLIKVIMNIYFLILCWNILFIY